jgi:hypothetical protein
MLYSFRLLSRQPVTAVERFVPMVPILWSCLENSPIFPPRLLGSVREFWLASILGSRSRVWPMTASGRFFPSTLPPLLLGPRLPCFAVCCIAWVATWVINRYMSRLSLIPRNPNTLAPWHLQSASARSIKKPPSPLSRQESQARRLLQFHHTSHDTITAFVAPAPGTN